MSRKLQVVLSRQYFYPRLFWNEKRFLRKDFLPLGTPSVYQWFIEQGFMVGFSKFDVYDSPYKLEELSSAPYIRNLGPLILAASSHPNPFALSDLIINPERDADGREIVRRNPRIFSQLGSMTSEEHEDLEADWFIDDEHEDLEADCYADDEDSVQEFVAEGRGIPIQDPQDNLSDLDNYWVHDRRDMLSRGVLRTYDQRYWHFPISVRVRHLVSLALPNSPGTAWPAQARLHIHLYPYGLVIVFLSVSLTSPKPGTIATAVARVQQLLADNPRRGAVLTAKVGRLVASSPLALMDSCARLIGESVLRNAPDRGMIKSDLFRTVAWASEGFSEADRIAMLRLVPYPDVLSDSLRGVQASLFGKYDSDSLDATTTGMVVNVSPTQFSKGSQQRFVKNLILVAELARAQRFLLPYLGTAVERILSPTARRDWRRSDVHRITRLVAALETAYRIYRPHHRKWYHVYSQVLSLDRQIVDVNAKLERLYQTEISGGIKELIRKVNESERVRINISGGNVGVLNLGTIIGKIESHLSAISPTSEEREKVRTGLKELAEAIIAADDMSDDTRQEALESVDFLAVSAADEEQQPHLGAIRPVLVGLAGTLGAVASTATVWDVWGNTIMKFFGLA